MKRLKYLLISLFFVGCTTQYVTIEETKMVDEGRILHVKKHRANTIKKRLKEIGKPEPEYRGGEMILYFEQLDSTIRFRPKEIKELSK